MTCLVFDTEAEAITAQEQVTTNMTLPQVNSNAASGIAAPGKQQTTAWAEVVKVYNQNKWYIPKPESQYMTGVVGHTEMEHDSSWDQPLE